MQIRTYGVRLGLAADLTVTDLFEQLEQIEGTDFEYRESTHALYVDQVRKFSVALFISVRDHRKYMTRKKEGKKILIKPNEVAAGETPIDFNLLAIHNDTRRGLYTHYKGSLSVGKLEGILGKQHRLAVAVKRTAWSEEHEDAMLPGKLLRESRKQYRGHFLLQQITNAEKMDEFMTRLDEITALDVELHGTADEEPAFTPFKNSVQGTKYSLRFKPHLEKQGLIARIKNLVNDESPTSGKIWGKQNGDQQFFNLFDPIGTVYSEQEFDAAAPSIDPDYFDKTALLVEMIGLMEGEYSDVFCEPEDAA